MTSSHTRFAINSPSRRRGAAMLVTMLVTTAVVAILFTALDQRRAQSVLANLGDDRERARLAAESVAALIEARLVNRAAETENLTRNVQDDPTLWWGLTGCSYTVGNSAVIPQRGLWFNGCVVRWRIEPVKITSQLDGEGGVYSVNRAIDPQAAPQRESDARAAHGQGTLLAGNPPFFHYRIVSEAYALTDRDEVDAAPWSQPGRHTVSVQSQRVIQLNLINLFDYAVFYGANGETGDLEFEPETDTVMHASMHSNGAVFLGGTGTVFTSKNYKKSASDGGLITMGSRGEKVEVSGVTGIFRMRKAANMYFASSAGNDEPTVKAPLDVPRPGKKVKQAKHQSFMSGLLDLNGGDGNPATEKVAINGEKFTYNRDSRSDWSLPENRIDPYIKDARSGGTAITTLAGIPQFSAHPLEPQRRVGAQVPLYRNRSTGAFTINPTRAAVEPLYYATSGDLISDPEPGARTVYATDMPLFRFDDGAGNIYEDVWPNQPLTPISASLAPAATTPDVDAPNGSTPPDRRHTWLPLIPRPRAAGAMLGYHLERSLFGNGTSTGLTIRERGQQNQAFQWERDGSAVEGFVISANPPERSAFSEPAKYVRAHVAWLKSNFVVYLGTDATGAPRDITDEFFDTNLAAAVAAGSPDRLVASVDRFVNRREARWLQDNGYFSAAAEMGPDGPDSARTLRARPLTLHLAQVTAFLRTPHAAFGGSAPGDVFNGIVYVHRTPRLSQVAGREDTHEVLAPLRYNPISDPAPLAPDAISNTPRAFLHLGPQSDSAVGSPGAWLVYPLHLPVRIDQAETIDLGTRPAGALPGVTIITPAPCYLRGSFNTIAGTSGKLPPCALFADSLTLLSNNWDDAENDQDSDYDGPLPQASDAELNLSLVLNNLPTDETNAAVGGSGGVHNLVRYLEDWSAYRMRLHGSVVVLNRMLYSRATLEDGTSQRAPQRTIIPDPGILGQGIKPPAAPSGIRVTRMVNTLDEVH